MTLAIISSASCEPDDYGATVPALFGGWCVRCRPAPHSSVVAGRHSFARHPLDTDGLGEQQAPVVREPIAVGPAQLLEVRRVHARHRPRRQWVGEVGIREGDRRYDFSLALNASMAFDDFERLA